MKSKKTFMGIALLIAVLVLSVGYAAVNSTSLQINGGAIADGEADFDVIFTEAQGGDNDGIATVASIDADDATIAYIDVSGMANAGDEATATYTIENTSNEFGADLSVQTTINPAELNIDEETGERSYIANSDLEQYFKVETSLTKSDLTNNDTSVLTVKVTLLKTPVTEAATTIAVEINADPKVI